MVDQAPFVKLHMQPLQDAIERAVGSPAAQSIVDRLPLAIPFGELSPLGSGVQDPQDAVERLEVVVPLPTTFSVGGQKILDHGELLGSQLVAAGHGVLRVPGDAMVAVYDSPDRT